MLKRLWFIFGPILIAMLLLITVLFLAPAKTSHNLSSEKRAASALTKIVFKNATIKKEALSDPNHRFVPFFGSSEWKRFDELHPSVLSEAYQRPYTPFLLGLQGAESLTHYFSMQQINTELENKQAVFFISPQWFTKKGQGPISFNYYFASDQGYRFLETAQNIPEDRYAARRFLKVSPTSSLAKYMKKIANGKSLSQFDLWQIKIQKSLAVHEDNLFSSLQFNNNFQKLVQPHAKRLPQPYNVQSLKQRADELGNSQSTNNEFGIIDNFFSTQIGAKLPKLKNSQRHFSYLQSPEYNDLQLVLNEFARNNTDVMFVIPPVNAKWQSYTGLSEDMYQKTVTKIKYQLYSQGFKHIADFSKQGNQEFFMEDTIHLGWNGWLAFDKHVNRFLTTKQVQPTYKLNDYFFSNQWANKKDIHIKK